MDAGRGALRVGDRATSDQILGQDADTGEGMRAGCDGDPVDACGLREAVARASRGYMTCKAVRLMPSHQGRACQVLARAFLDDPLYRQVFPDIEVRARSLRWVWRAVVQYCGVYGEVYTTPVLSGVACWLPPGRTGVTLWRTLRSGMPFPRAALRFGWSACLRFLAVGAALDRLHHQVMRQPHSYLWALGVEPSGQGQGIGGALLQRVLVRAADARVPCYLETLAAENVSFYHRHGFDVAGEGVLAGQGTVRVWAMVRESQGGRLAV